MFWKLSRSNSAVPCFSYGPRERCCPRGERSRQPLQLRPADASTLDGTGSWRQVNPPARGRLHARTRLSRTSIDPTRRMSWCLTLPFDMRATMARTSIDRTNSYEARTRHAVRRDTAGGKGLPPLRSRRRRGRKRGGVCRSRGVQQDPRCGGAQDKTQRARGAI